MRYPKLLLALLQFVMAVHAADLTGLVVDAKGAPAPLASVAVIERDSQAAYVVKADEEGRFLIPMRGEVTQEGIRADILIAWLGDTAMSYPLDVKPGQPLTLRLQTEGFARIEGRVVDEQGKPIAGAVTDWAMAFDYMTGAGPVPKEHVTDKDGRFVIPRFWAGSDDFVLFVSAKGYGSAALRDEVLEAGKTKTVAITLRKADQTISGVVVDSQGAPVPDVRVYISSDDQPHDLYTKTDANGAFRLGPACAGKEYVHATQATKTIRREVRAFITIPCEPLRLVLPDNNGEISGTVFDHEGKPLANVELSDWETSARTRSDAQGRFHLTGLKKGWRTLTAKASPPGGVEIEHRARFKTGSTDVRLQLPAKTRPSSYASSTPVNLVGKPASELRIRHWINSAPLTSKAGGKVRILDFWGLQCAPCIASMPKVQAFWSQHRETVEVIALSDYFPLEEVNEFLLKHADWQFPIALEANDSTAVSDYDLHGVPTYIVIATDGRIQLSTHEWSEAEAAALKLMGGK